MARKLSLIFIILLIFGVHNLKSPTGAYALSNKVTVSAVVLEQINYKRNKEEVLVETNYEKGFWIISGGNFKESINKKAVFKLPLEKNIIIVPKI